MTTVTDSEGWWWWCFFKIQSSNQIKVQTKSKFKPNQSSNQKVASTKIQSSNRIPTTYYHPFPTAKFKSVLLNLTKTKTNTYQIQSVPHYFNTYQIQSVRHYFKSARRPSPDFAKCTRDIRQYRARTRARRRPQVVAVHVDEIGSFRVQGEKLLLVGRSPGGGSAVGEEE